MTDIITPSRATAKLIDGKAAAAAVAAASADATAAEAPAAEPTPAAQPTPAAAAADIPTQVITEGSVKKEYFDSGYFIYQSQNMSFEQVQHQIFTPSPNRMSLGTNAQVAWSKIKLENSRASDLTLYLHHTNAFNNRAIELYEVSNGEVLQKRVLDMNNAGNQPWMLRGSAVFDIHLQGQQQMTLFVKHLGYSHQWYELNLYDENESKRALISLYSDVYLFAGMLLALIIFNFLLYFSSRLIEHLFYACFLISGALWITFSYGLQADLLNIYGYVTLKWHLSLVAMPIFLMLFMMSIFETKKKYPVEHWTLITMVVLLVINLAYGLYDIVTVLQYSNGIASLVMLMTIFVTISMVVRKHPDSLFFLFGHGLFVIFSSMAVLFYNGDAEYSYVNSHGVGIAIILEALMLSLIIAYRMRSFELLKEAQADLQRLADTDPLTHLFNRRHFGNAANRLLKDATKIRQATSIAIIDIDHFKNINDQYGHPGGARP